MDAECNQRSTHFCWPIAPSTARHDYRYHACDTCLFRVRSALRHPVTQCCYPGLDFLHSLQSSLSSSSSTEAGFITSGGPLESARSLSSSPASSWE